MRRYIAQRLLQIVLTFFLFLTVVFFLLEAQPGDYSQTFLSNPRLTQAQREALRTSLGLDGTPVERYVSYMRALLRGNLGISFTNFPRPVLDVILERAPRTIALFLTATVVSFYIGFLAGKVLAWKRGKFIEYPATIGGVLLYTVFTPWFGLMMIWLFAVLLDLLPIGKFVTVELWSGSPYQANEIFVPMLGTLFAGSLVLFFVMLSTRQLEARKRSRIAWGTLAAIVVAVLVLWVPGDRGKYAADILRHLLLPVLTLSLISFAGTMLLTRNSMLETLREDYVMAARAKGLSEKVIRDKHAARNAMLPVVTSFVFALAFALDGGVITETIFSWPGMGLTLLTAAQAQDIPMVMGGLVFTGTLALSAHLLADIMYAYLDPRIRYA